MAWRCKQTGHQWNISVAEPNGLTFIDFFTFTACTLILSTITPAKNEITLWRFFFSSHFSPCKPGNDLWWFRTSLYFKYITQYVQFSSRVCKTVCIVYEKYSMWPQIFPGFTFIYRRFLGPSCSRISSNHIAPRILSQEWSWWHYGCFCEVVCTRFGDVIIICPRLPYWFSDSIIRWWWVFVFMVTQFRVHAWWMSQHTVLVIRVHIGNEYWIFTRCPLNIKLLPVLNDFTLSGKWSKVKRIRIKSPSLQ